MDAHDMIQQIADAIEAHADGLSMDDENDRRAMAEWIAENFDPKQLMGEGLTVADGRVKMGRTWDGAVLVRCGAVRSGMGTGEVYSRPR